MRRPHALSATDRGACRARASRAALALGAWLCLIGLTLVPGAFADTGSGKSEEYELKAAFLYHFTEFVEWPADAFPRSDAPFTIAIVGDDPFGSVLDEMVEGEKAGARNIVVRRYSAVEQLGECQMVFVGISEPGPLDHALSALGRRKVLTVGDGRAFSARSGMITFLMNKRRVRLRINVAAARSAGLTISSKLLRQAEIIGPGGGK
jgi:hypothetical protein